MYAPQYRDETDAGRSSILLTYVLGVAMAGFIAFAF
jgi:hypothetical protein